MRTTIAQELGELKDYWSRLRSSSRWVKIAAFLLIAEGVRHLVISVTVTPLTFHTDVLPYFAGAAIVVSGHRYANYLIWVPIAGETLLLPIMFRQYNRVVELLATPVVGDLTLAEITNDEGVYFSEALNVWEFLGYTLIPKILILVSVSMTVFYPGARAFYTKKWWPPEAETGKFGFLFRDR